MKFDIESFHKPAQHSIGKAVFLHLFPGALLTVTLWLLAPMFIEWGLPIMLALVVAEALFVLPLMIGILFYHARKSGLPDTSTIISYRENIGTRKLLLYTGILLLWAIIIFGLLAPFTEWIKQELFFWVPNWFNLGEYINYQNSYTKEIVILTWFLALFWTSITAPIVEELYFRGFLLPAISRLGNWAPLLNTLLFVLYHFWSLWLLPVRIIALLPMVYMVWFKRSIYLAILVHVLLNLIGDSILTIPFVFGNH